MSSNFKILRLYDAVFQHFVVQTSAYVHSKWEQSHSNEEFFAAILVAKCGVFALYFDECIIF